LQVKYKKYTFLVLLEKLFKIRINIPNFKKIMSYRFLDKKIKDLKNFALINKEIYQSAKPFPHIVIDNFLSEDFLNKILVEFPDLEKEGSVKKFKDGFSIKLALTKIIKFIFPKIILNFFRKFIN